MNMKMNVKIVQLIVSLSMLTLGLVAAPQAQASMYITASVSSSESHMGFSEYESQYGSASIGFDLWRYLRLSISHSQELSITQGYKDPNADSMTDTDAANDDDSTNDDQLVEYYNRTHVIGNSVDLQLILYEGQIFVPYVMGGMILKSYTTETREGTKSSKVKKGPVPGPNVGLGLGVRLNKEFTLKLAFIASPGVTRELFSTEDKSVWDKKVTLGLTYQL